MITTPSTSYSYKATLEAAHKVTWRVEDIIGGDKRLNFNKPFMPEALAGVEPIACLNSTEKLILNQIRGHSYLYLFGVVEKFIVPLVLHHLQTIGTEDIIATQTFLCFAEEEGKHIHLFQQFEQEFKAGFGTPCGCIGPAKDISEAVLKHHPLGVALATLQIEWMTQHHYLDSIQGDQILDPQFCSLLKHHWLEEAQHAKLDTLMLETMVQNLDEAEIQTGIEAYFEIGGFLDSGLMTQVQLDIESLQTAIGRTFTDAEKQEIQTIQEKAYRWTFLGSGMTHPNFLNTLGKLSAAAVLCVQEMANTMG
jgi:hypothetical protein